MHYRQNKKFETLFLWKLECLIYKLYSYKNTINILYEYDCT